LSLILSEEYRLKVFENSAEYLDLRGRKWQEAEENCIMRSFIIHMLLKILLGGKSGE